jgi:hypothetical protein
MLFPVLVRTTDIENGPDAIFVFDYVLAAKFFKQQLVCLYSPFLQQVFSHPLFDFHQIGRTCIASLMHVVQMQAVC